MASTPLPEVTVTASRLPPSSTPIPALTVAAPRKPGVPVYDPKVSVILRKNIGRANISGQIAASQRFQGTARSIDLTPYLGENSSVVVSLSTHQSAGMWSVILADNMVWGEAEFLYGVIEPLDLVDIRMAHDTSLYAARYPQHMPMVMRGWVTDVERGEIMVGEGTNARPQRTVTISGQNYGKVLLLSQIAYLFNDVTGQNLLTAFKAFENYGIGAKAQDASAFVNNVMAKVVAPFLAQMRTAATANGVAQGISPIKNINVNAIVQDGEVYPLGVQHWPGGTIYDLLHYFGDVGPWNELFIEDREDAPYLVYRPNPFRDTTGNWISEPYISTPGSQPSFIDILDTDLVANKPKRTDSGVANYYWVDAPRYNLHDGMMLGAVGSAVDPSTIYLADYPNSSPYLYGLRRMDVQSQQGERIDGLPAAVQAEMEPAIYSFMNARRATLMAYNRDNVVFEQGSMILRGNEAIRAGNYIRLYRGIVGGGGAQRSGLVTEYYAHTVTHNFLPFRSFTTTALYDRGTGFIVRSQMEGGANSPYFAEMEPYGVYQ